MLLGQESTVNALHFMNLGNDPSLQNADHILQGKCTYKPGDLKSKLPKDFKVKKLDGIWRNAYDEKTLNENFRCQTYKIHFEDKKANPLLIYEAANGYSIEHRETLWNAKNDAAFAPYKINKGLHMNFRHKDPTIAYLESSDIKASEEDLFAHNHPNWAQVIDYKEGKLSDTQFTLYSCMQSAKYFDSKSGEQLTYADLKKKGLVERLEDPKKGSDTLTKFKVSDKVRKEEYYKERVQVLDKIDIDKLHKTIVTDSTVYQRGLPYHKMPEIKETISKVVPKFTEEFLEQNYDYQEQYGNSLTFLREGESLDNIGKWYK